MKWLSLAHNLLTRYQGLFILVAIIPWLVGSFTYYAEKDLINAKLDLIVAIILYLMWRSNPKIGVDTRHHIIINQYKDEDQFVLHSIESWYGKEGDSIPEKFNSRNEENHDK